MAAHDPRRVFGNVFPVHGWWTTVELAYFLALSPRTLQRWRAAGFGPPWFKVGRFVRYDCDQVARWLLALEHQQNPQLEDPGGQLALVPTPGRRGD